MYEVIFSNNQRVVGTTKVDKKELEEIESTVFAPSRPRYIKTLDKAGKNPIWINLNRVVNISIIELGD